MNQSSRNNWPDPEKPGFPQHPERDGVHALVMLGNTAPPEIGKWSASSREWTIPGASLPKSVGWASNVCRYLSPLFDGNDMRAAYEKGVNEGFDAAMPRIAEAEERAVRDVQGKHQADLLAARRAGAEDMRRRAALTAEATDASLLANQLRTFDDAGSGTTWHRRLRVEAILAIPLPGDPESVVRNHAQSSSMIEASEVTEHFVGYADT